MGQMKNQNQNQNHRIFIYYRKHYQNLKCFGFLSNSKVCVIHSLDLKIGVKALTRNGKYKGHLPPKPLFLANTF